ncbi:BZ3500_MvSof-1268-A1-R1_Chr7-1g09369 [Microbotryum saponariae]|uniref:BZ3500_MvSof-1268-A1-R1_Chr7-1g09369 protein n=1 Tax=Microbotryum saponariae TaxID=289078 RepID=A0A2X0N348_9BASI|nr:BZ3501_MvSof-1269-A2-R1_Chr7-1g09074 [Microbotryum saponariae]SDA03308.1 BZ3500_MvSof-1268-A1-R1_Chr7-1g09369 [Microbotryum saponariae]
MRCDAMRCDAMRFAAATRGRVTGLRVFPLGTFAQEGVPRVILLLRTLFKLAVPRDFDPVEADDAGDVDRSVRADRRDFDRGRVGAGRERVTNGSVARGAFELASSSREAHATASKVVLKSQRDGIATAVD